MAEKLKPERLSLESFSIIENKKEQLKKLFPEVFTEGKKIDFERLKLTLGEAINNGKERYGLNWSGKADCFRVIQSPSSGTLLPVRNESVNFEESENVIIEGDNLEALKLLQKSYLGKVKMIYIDPPYNTGNDFIYPDDYGESLETYLKYTGQVDNEGRRYSTNTETEGRFHSKWLSMMYPRLFLARNLLREDGVIFVSIDDGEVANLRAICNEIFGEENFVGLFVKQSKVGGGSDSKFIVKEHEYCCLYARSLDFLQEFFVEHDKDYLKRYCETDEQGRFFWDTLARPGLKNPIVYDVVAPDGTIISGDWIRSKQRYEQDIKKGEIRFIKKADGNWSVQFKQRLNEQGKKPRSLSSNFGGTIASKNELDMLGFNSIFYYAKSAFFLNQLIKIVTSTSSSDIILDFFAGSGTTAHAVLDLNKQDGGNRKFILVQLPEPTEREDYPTIADICKERVRRVIKKLNEEDGEDGKQAELDFGDSSTKTKQDRGFKVFKLSTSNFKPWNAELKHDVKQLEMQLSHHANHIIEGREQEDILYEILIKSGFDLSAKIEKLVLAGKTVFSVAGGPIHICLEYEITKEVIREMAELRPERVICLDYGFLGNDQLKTNAVETMKAKKITFRTV